MDLKTRIAKLQKRINELHGIRAGETLASFNETTQTNLSIQIYEKQLQELKKELVENKLHKDKSKIRIYTILSHDGKKLKYHLTDTQPDPFNKIISRKSPLGKLLEKAKVNEHIELNGKTYQVIEITNAQG